MRNAKTAITGEANFGLERGLCRGNVLSLLVLGASAYLAYTNFAEAQRLEKAFHDSLLEEEDKIWNALVGKGVVDSEGKIKSAAYLTDAKACLTTLSAYSDPIPYSAKDCLEKAVEELGKSGDSRAGDIIGKIKDQIIPEIDAHLSGSASDTAYLRRMGLTGSVKELVDEASEIFTEYGDKVAAAINEISSKKNTSFFSGFAALLSGLYFGYHKHEVEEREGKEELEKETEK